MGLVFIMMELITAIPVHLNVRIAVHKTIVTPVKILIQILMEFVNAIQLSTKIMELATI